MENKSVTYEMKGPLDVVHESSNDSGHGNGGIRTGTDVDAADMYRLGKTQEYKRNFRSLSILGLSSISMGTWVAVLSASSFSLINGGLGGSIWVYLAVWFCTCSVTLSLAEMASMAPTSGGQYHWTSEFAPPHMQKFLSYIVGWLSALGWQAAIATTAYSSGALILELAAIQSPSYVPKQWHATLMTIAVAFVAVLVNTMGAKRLPLIELVSLFIHVAGFFVIIIVLWTVAPKAPASQVFGSFSNFGGWSSVGAACVVGQLTASGSLSGSDSPAHLAEEVRNASLVVPRMMVLTILLNGLLGFIMIITYLFCITNLEVMIIQSTAPFPFVDVFYAATGSQSGTIAMACLPTILTICCCFSVLAAASRQAWAFGRDQGLPFSTWFRQMRTVGTPIPLNAIFFSLSITIILSLLNLGGSEAFNSIVGLLSGSGGVSYTVSISCVLYKKLRGEPLPTAKFSLGRWGIPVNAFAVCYCIMQTVISFFPLFAQVTAKTMNYGIVMFGGVTILSMVYYFLQGRHVYKGPVVYIVKD